MDDEPKNKKSKKGTAGRTSGVPNYNNEILLGIIGYFLPMSIPEWEKVADAYFEQSGEEIKRKGTAIQKHFGAQLMKDKVEAEKGNKAMSDITRKALEVSNLIKTRSEQIDIGGASSDDESEISRIEVTPVIGDRFNLQVQDCNFDDEDDDEGDEAKRKKGKTLSQKSYTDEKNSLPKTKGGRSDARGGIGKSLVTLAETFATSMNSSSNGVTAEDLNQFANQISEKSSQQTNVLVSELRNMQQQSSNQMMMMMMVMLGKSPEDIKAMSSLTSTNVSAPFTPSSSSSSSSSSSFI